MPRQVAAAAEAAALRHQQQLEEEQQYQQYQQYQRQQQQHQRQQQQQQQALEQQAAAEEGDDGSDLDELFPGEPDKAVRELIDRGDRRNSGAWVVCSLLLWVGGSSLCLHALCACCVAAAMCVPWIAKSVCQCSNQHCTHGRWCFLSRACAAGAAPAAAAAAATAGTAQQHAAVCGPLWWPEGSHAG